MFWPPDPPLLDNHFRPLLAPAGSPPAVRPLAYLALATAGPFHLLAGGPCADRRWPHLPPCRRALSRPPPACPPARRKKLGRKKALLPISFSNQETNPRLLHHKMDGEKEFVRGMLEEFSCLADSLVHSTSLLEVPSWPARYLKFQKMMYLQLSPSGGQHH